MWCNAPHGNAFLSIELISNISQSFLHFGFLIYIYIYIYIYIHIVWNTMCCPQIYLRVCSFPFAGTHSPVYFNPRQIMDEPIKSTKFNHYDNVIMSAMSSQITSLAIVYSTVYLGADQRKHQSSASLAFVLGIHRSPVNSPHKGPVTRKMFPFDDVIVSNLTDFAFVCRI